MWVLVTEKWKWAVHKPLGVNNWGVSQEWVKLTSQDFVSKVAY